MYISPDQRHIFGLKGDFLLIQEHLALTAATESDLDTVVKMKIDAALRTDPPLVSVQDQDGEVRGQLVASVF